jgi:uncharacterized protein (TIGR03067 family)
MYLRLLALAVFLLSPTLCTPKEKPDKEKPDKEEVKKIQGTWGFTSVERDGKQLAFVAGSVWKIKGDKIETTPVLVEFSFKLGSNKKWKTIDRTFLKDFFEKKNSNEGKTIRGIYKLEGDVLTVCEAEIEGPRPEEFNSKDRRTITVLKRLKE